MNTSKKILVALDLDQQSLIALKFAEIYAELLKYELEVISVIEESNLITKLFSTDEIVVKINEDLNEKINQAIKPFEGRVKINTQIAYGKPYEKIAELANKIRPAFIVMGRSEIAKQGMSFLGSNCLHVILESGFPVITLRGNYNFEKYQKDNKEILVPLDFKKDVREQVSAAIEFAGLFNMPIHLLSIQTSGSKGREAKILTQLGITKKIVSDAGIKCTSELIFEPEKKVYEIICNQAVKRSAAMVVIMTRAENKLTNLFMGSNALDIIHHSDLPVLSIQPWDLDSDTSMFKLISDPLNVYK